jgi:hypothetical protein
MEGRLEKFSYIFDQRALSEDGANAQDQYIRFTALDGINGRMYCISTPTNWSFTEPEELLKLAEDFVKISNMIV